MKIIGRASGVSLIVWQDDHVDVVVPTDQFDRVLAHFDRPVTKWRSALNVLDGVPVGMVDELVKLDPGTDEHAVYAILALPGGSLIDDGGLLAEEDADEESS